MVSGPGFVTRAAERMNDKNTDQLDIHTLAGVVLAVVAPLGVAANAYVFVSVLRRRKTRSSFLTLCASKALFNLITCFVFLFWCTPTAFRGSYFLPPIVGLIFGDVIGGMVYLGGVITQDYFGVMRKLQNYRKSLKTVSTLSTCCLRKCCPDYPPTTGGNFCASLSYG
ncbi:hypothetical protein NECAME_06200 [Necator americanus]|uniref:7TM GPCR serpentine receptor class x (Srx) domain-containing protein n=1 Tax=Necator americanus TaxID=51031 RepID=W2TVH2_NECAM|nr:hypothetical protein NECAME_06200 [Necator americanus]ETN85783.1 hypothetical protein NECAME_06200 [Necator americanus]